MLKIETTYVTGWFFISSGCLFPTDFPRLRHIILQCYNMYKYEHGMKLATYLSYIIFWLARKDPFWCSPSIFITVVLCSVGRSDISSYWRYRLLQEQWINLITSMFWVSIFWTCSKGPEKEWDYRNMADMATKIYNSGCFYNDAGGGNFTWARTIKLKCILESW